MSDTEVLRVIEEIRIEAPVERVFHALTDPTEIMAWWTIPGQYETRAADMDVRVGGRYRLSGTSARRGTFAVSGEYRIVEPPHRLSYTWIPDWDDGAHGSVVDIRLEPDGDGTRLILTHTGFATQSALDDHIRGWPAVLQALRARAEAGVTA